MGGHESFGKGVAEAVYFLISCEREAIDRADGSASQRFDYCNADSGRSPSDRLRTALPESGRTVSPCSAFLKRASGGALGRQRRIRTTHLRHARTFLQIALTSLRAGKGVAIQLDLAADIDWDLRHAFHKAGTPWRVPDLWQRCPCTLPCSFDTKLVRALSSVLFRRNRQILPLSFRIRIDHAHWFRHERSSRSRRECPAFPLIASGATSFPATARLRHHGISPRGCAAMFISMASRSSASEQLPDVFLITEEAGRSHQQI